MTVDYLWSTRVQQLRSWIHTPPIGAPAGSVTRLAQRTGALSEKIVRGKSRRRDDDLDYAARDTIGVFPARQTCHEANR